MQTPTQTEELIVWTQPKALDEAKSLFAPYSPKFQTVPCTTTTALGKTWVSVPLSIQPRKRCCSREHPCHT